MAYLYSFILCDLSLLLFLYIYITVLSRIDFYRWICVYIVKSSSRISLPSTIQISKRPPLSHHFSNPSIIAGVGLSGERSAAFTICHLHHSHVVDSWLHGFIDTYCMVLHKALEVVAKACFNSKAVVLQIYCDREDNLVVFVPTESVRKHDSILCKC